MGTVVTKSNEWYTPQYILAAVRLVMGGIDLDPASCTEANQTVKVAKYYTEADNGLVQPWCGRVWLNPPFSHTTAAKGMESGDRPLSLMRLWINKLIREYQDGNVSEAILCTKADPKQNWFQLLWGHPVCFAEDRVYFSRPGLAPEKMMFGTAFVYFGQNEDRFTEVFSQFGHIDTSPARPPALTLWDAFH